jgi:hypothetical protein
LEASAVALATLTLSGVVMSRHVFGLMVGGNEAHRYVVSAVENALKSVDVLFYYDDRSTDGTYELLEPFMGRWNRGNLIYWQREPDVPSFLEHEGRFRQNAWDCFEDCLHPQNGQDWVIAIDTDEVLCGPTECRPCELKKVMDRADPSYDAVRIAIKECFGFDEKGWPMVRTDGWWGKIRGTRIFRYRKDGVFKDVPMACGSEPSYVEKRAIEDMSVHILHLGYAHPEDQREKYERYSLRTGHGSAHIESILATPTLKPWDGLVPPTMTRGS